MGDAKIDRDDLLAPGVQRLLDRAMRRMRGAGPRVEEAITYAIGDVHGAAGALLAMLSEIAAHASGRPMRIVMLGDLIDKGAQSAQCIEMAMRLREGLPEGACVALRGNHEQMLAETLSGDAGDYGWLDHPGRGVPTLASYGVGRGKAGLARLPPSHVAWIGALPASHADELRYYVHAGLRPGIPFGEQSLADLTGMRRIEVKGDPDHGRHVVHGHLATAGRPECSPNRTNVDTGCGHQNRLTCAVLSMRRARPESFISVDWQGQGLRHAQAPWMPPTAERRHPKAGSHDVAIPHGTAVKRPLVAA